MNYYSILTSAVCFAVLLLIMKNTRVSSDSIRCYKSFMRLLVASLGMTVMDMGYVVVCSFRSEYPGLLHVFNSITETYIGLCLWIWFIFAMNYIVEDMSGIKRLMTACNVCALVAIILVFSNSFAHITSSIDSNGEYRVKVTIWTLIIAAATMFVLIVGTVYAVKYYIKNRKVEENESGKVVLWMSLIPLLFFIGWLLPLDSPVYSIMFLTPCLSFYFVHVTDEKRMTRAIIRKKEQLEETLIREKRNESVINSIAKMFFCVYYIDMSDYSFKELDVSNVSEVETAIGSQGDAREKFNVMCKKLVVPKQADMMREFCDLNTLRKRIQNVDYLSIQFEGPHVGWCEGVFIVVSRNRAGQCTEVLWAVRSIRKEREYFIQSNTDELTGFFNRRAYENDLEIVSKMSLNDNFVYMLTDVNELKTTNDSLGHEAGDEIIKAVSSIIRRCFGEFGKLYRIGGDEFVVLMYIDEEQLEVVKRDFDRNINSWRGEIVERVSTSNGYALKKESPDATIDELAVIADKRMYEAKDLYYQIKGIDRRGQQAAFEALRQTYVKILKINLTDDSYKIIQMDEDEKSIEKGFNVSLSDWLESFANCGQIAESDRERFIEETNIDKLKQHFVAGNNSFSIRYMRVTDGESKEAVMDIVTTKEYRDDKQELFLAVKCL